MLFRSGRLSESNRASEERSTIGKRGLETRSTDSNRASEDRNTMAHENRLQAKTRANQHKYAKNLARSF